MSDTVRLATIDDIDELRELCLLLHDENGMLPIDDDLVDELLHAFTAHEPTPNCQNPGAAGVIERKGKLTRKAHGRVGQTDSSPR